MSKEYLGKIIELVTAAFGLVAALAWNAAIQELIERFYQAGDTLTGKFIYALVITLFAVLITMVLARMHDRIGKKK
ncbi:hypothetical protein HYW32_02825 [Candidatus Berkelbacteria bacterium]|nr:hypothetical protein [Candidatus Berkelbacteria bacterium]